MNTVTRKLIFSRSPARTDDLSIDVKRPKRTQGVSRTLHFLCCRYVREVSGCSMQGNVVLCLTFITGCIGAWRGQSRPSFSSLWLHMYYSRIHWVKSEINYFELSGYGHCTLKRLGQHGATNSEQQRPGPCELWFNPHGQWWPEFKMTDRTLCVVVAFFSEESRIPKTLRHRYWSSGKSYMFVISHFQYIGVSFNLSRSRGH